MAAGTVDGDIQLWDLANLQSRSSLVGHRGYVDSVCFSPDGKSLASAGQDGSVRLWDVRTSQEVGAVVADGNHNYEAVAFAPDGLTLVAGGKGPRGGVLRTWSLIGRSAPGRDVSADPFKGAY